MVENGVDASDGSEPRRYSIAEMAAEVGLPANTVRSHFATFADAFPPEADVGPRGKRVYSQQTFDRYKMFLRLKSDQVRLLARDAVKLLVNGHYATLLKAGADPADLLVAVHQLTAAEAQTASQSSAQRVGT